MINVQQACGPPPAFQMQTGAYLWQTCDKSSSWIALACSFLLGTGLKWLKKWREKGLLFVYYPSPSISLCLLLGGTYLRSVIGKPALEEQECTPRSLFLCFCLTISSASKPAQPSPFHIQLPICNLDPKHFVSAFLLVPPNPSPKKGSIQRQIGCFCPWGFSTQNRRKKLAEEKCS